MVILFVFVLMLTHFNTGWWSQFFKFYKAARFHQLDLIISDRCTQFTNGPFVQPCHHQNLKVLLGPLSKKAHSTLLAYKTYRRVLSCIVVFIKAYDFPVSFDKVKTKPRIISAL